MCGENKAKVLFIFINSYVSILFFHSTLNTNLLDYLKSMGKRAEAKYVVFGEENFRSFFYYCRFPITSFADKSLLLIIESY